jgi:hypothetical protein
VSGAQRSRIDKRCVISRNPDVSFTRLHDDMLAIDERAGYCYSMNVSATRIWELMMEPVTVGDICTVLCRDFVVTEETCLSDVAELLSTMRETGLVRVESATLD